MWESEIVDNKNAKDFNARDIKLLTLYYELNFICSYVENVFES